jgi:hypothetical protein
MSKLPPLKRLVLEDLPSEVQAWAPKLIEPLNQFMAAVSGGLDRKLTLADNCVAQFRTLTITIDGDNGGNTTANGTGTAGNLAKWTDTNTIGDATADDVPDLPWSKITSGVPTTLSGYGVSAADVLATVKTVDGAGSGLDADLLDGAQGSAYARLASPAFTGTPTAPTQSAGNSSTRLATTAFVATAVAAGGGGTTVESGRVTVPTTSTSASVAVSGMDSNSVVVVTPVDSTAVRGPYRVTTTSGSFSIILASSGSPAVEFMWMAII